MENPFQSNPRLVKQLQMLYEMIKMVEDNNAGRCLYEVVLFMIAVPQESDPDAAFDAFLKAWGFDRNIFDF